MLTHSTVGKNVQQYLHPEGTNNRPATGNVNRMIKILVIKCYQKFNQIFTRFFFDVNSNPSGDLHRFAAVLPFLRHGRITALRS
jgi:hypothetical protein